MRSHTDEVVESGSEVVSSTTLLLPDCGNDDWLDIVLGFFFFKFPKLEKHSPDQCARQNKYKEQNSDFKKIEESNTIQEYEERNGSRETSITTRHARQENNDLNWEGSLTRAGLKKKRREDEKVQLGRDWPITVDGQPTALTS